LVTVFSDYVCPFCYIGHNRLAKLRDEYDLKVYWRFVEIHPETAAEGQCVDSLGYAPEQWRLMMENLGQMAEEDGLDLGNHHFTTNSHRALLLAEASKEQGAEVFYKLNEYLYSAFFVDGLNIGDPEVLRKLARDCAVPNDIVERAWSDPKYEIILTKNLRAAVANQVSGTPTFFVGEERIAGAVSLEKLRQAAEHAIQRE
jgi:predicted DsbA family dithiol-disulfide isomerase